METIKNNIALVINALNNVETKGVQNLNNLVGSINILQETLNKLSEPPEVVNEE